MSTLSPPQTLFASQRDWTNSPECSFLEWFTRGSHPKHGYLKYDLWTSSVGITWELVKNSDSHALSQIYCLRIGFLINPQEVPMHIKFDRWPRTSFTVEKSKFSLVPPCKCLHIYQHILGWETQNLFPDVVLFTIFIFWTQILSIQSGKVPWCSCSPKNWLILNSGQESCRTEFLYWQNFPHNWYHTKVTPCPPKDNFIW
jgi:hypothetical protein